jgi:hypothetical protein
LEGADAGQAEIPRQPDAGCVEELPMTEEKVIHIGGEEPSLRTRKAEALYEEAKEAAREEAQADAEEAAKDAAEEAAKETYDARYQEVYDEVYEEAYKKALGE